MVFSGCPKPRNTAVLPSNTAVSGGISAFQEKYTISPQDVLEISVYKEEEMEKTVRVSHDGFITYPFAGKIKAEGLTVIELEEELTGILGRDYFVDPQVTVFVKAYHSRKVFIMGQVKNPGSYSFTPERPLTVIQAITLAGGFTDLASRNGTKVIRVEDGVEKTIEVKITDIMKKGDSSKDITLQPNDVIVVPERVF